MTPLTPAVFHVLLALAAGDRHGYGIMQDIAAHTDGAFKMGAGTLYGTIQRLMDLGFVREVGSPPPQSARDERRRHYRLTSAGRRVLDAEVWRLEQLVRVARGVPGYVRSGKG
jgi:DNA-binding PadR family transcriptional regulator